CWCCGRRCVSRRGTESSCGSSDVAMHAGEKCWLCLLCSARRRSALSPQARVNITHAHFNAQVFVAVTSSAYILGDEGAVRFGAPTPPQPCLGDAYREVDVTGTRKWQFDIDADHAEIDVQCGSTEDAFNFTNTQVDSGARYFG